ncbi:site-specific integrase [Candidatus Pacearchaeota archaeon]|nr:site-specific integrase [Candidatus Pacearchaeota archaeon]
MERIIIEKPIYHIIVEAIDKTIKLSDEIGDIRIEGKFVIIPKNRFHKTYWRYDWSKFPKKEKPFLKKYLADYELGKISTNAFTNENRETLSRYALTLKAVLEILKKPVDELSVKQVDDFVRRLNKGEIQKSFETQKQYRMQLATYIEWRFKNIYSKNPALAVTKYAPLTQSLRTRIKHKEKSVVVISEDEVDKLYKKCSNSEEKYLIAMLFSSGARIAEFLNIRFSDIEFPEGKENFCKLTLRTENSKTEGRTIPLYYKNSLEAVRDFVEERKKGLEKRKHYFEFKSQEDFVWVTPYASSDNMIKRIGKRANMILHFHLFRHSSANWLRERFSDSQMDYFFGWRYGSPMKARYGGGKSKMMFKEVTKDVVNTEISELKHQMDKQSYENKMKGEELNKLKADMEDLKGNLMKELKDKLKKEILSESRK